MWILFKWFIYNRWFWNTSHWDDLYRLIFKSPLENEFHTIRQSNYRNWLPFSFHKEMQSSLLSIKRHINLCNNYLSVLKFVIPINKFYRFCFFICFFFSFFTNSLIFFLFSCKIALFIFFIQMHNWTTITLNKKYNSKSWKVNNFIKNNIILITKILNKLLFIV